MIPLLRSVVFFAGLLVIAIGVVVAYIGAGMSMEAVSSDSCGSLGMSALIMFIGMGVIMTPGMIITIWRKEIASHIFGLPKP